MSVMARKFLFMILALLLLFASFSSTSASSVTSSPARIVNGFLLNAISRLMKWVKSLRATTKTAINGRPMMKFESGYNVETVFDGSKLGIEPHTVEILPSGDLLILDSANSNLYRISSSLSLYSRPKLVAGSAEGNPGHVDGRLKEARMNHPKGLTIDDRGNIYIADTENMAIRKISDAGITTIAGGKKGRGSGHVDGPSEEAKFSNDFDVVYVGSSCSLLVIDRGNQAIREIQLHFDDCAYQYGSGFPLGIAVLVAAGFFGYMLALLQRRVGNIVSSQEDQRMIKANSTDAYKKPMKLSSMRPPLIPTEGEEERQDESFIGSLGKLLSQTGASAAEILGGLFPWWFQKKSWTTTTTGQYQQQDQLIHQQNKYNSNTWPLQDSYVIRDEDDPPSIETRTPTPRKTYPFMSKDSEKMQQFRQGRAFYNGWDGNFQQQQQKQQQPPQQMQTQTQTQKQQYRHQYHSSSPQTYYEQSSEKTDEVVFGAVQQDGDREAMVIKPLDHGNNIPYDRRAIRSRINNMACYPNLQH